MPSTSPAQARLMAAAAHDPKFAKKAGISQSVAKEFNQADKGTVIIHPKKDDTPAEKKLEGSWKRHPGTGKFVSTKPKTKPKPEPPDGIGKATKPGFAGKTTFGW